MFYRRYDATLNPVRRFKRGRVQNYYKRQRREYEEFEYQRVLANEPGFAWSVKRVGLLLLALVITIIMVANAPQGTKVGQMEVRHNSATGTTLGVP